MFMSASITLSKPMQQFVAEQTAARGLKSESEFVDQLLKEERKRMEVQKLVKKLKESEESGFRLVNDEYWENLKKRVDKKFRAGKQGTAR